MWEVPGSTWGVCRGLHSRAAALRWLRACTCHNLRRVHSSKCSSGSTGCSRGSKGAWRYAVWSARLWGRWGACFATQKKGSFGPPYLYNQSEPRYDTHILRNLVRRATLFMSFMS